MNKKVRVPIVSLIIGVVLTLVNILTDYIIGKRAMDITTSMNSILTRSELILAVILITLAGLFLFRDMSREEVFKSGLLVSIYFGLVLLLESIFLRNGIYSSFISILFIPVRPYMALFNFLKIILNLGYPLSTMISLIGPLSYTVFANKG